MDESMINGMVSTITMYQTAFNTFTKENPELEFEEVITMVDSWWYGIMTMAGLAGQNKKP